MNTEQMQKWIVPAIIAIIFILILMAPGIVIGGILMGLMSTLAVWLTIKKLPQKIQAFCGKHPFITDLLFLKLSFAVFALLGSGVMIFCALMVQAVALGLLLNTMRISKKDNHGNNNLSSKSSTSHRFAACG